MQSNYDLIVLGTGTAGGIPARRCRKAGWSVLNVENRIPGGTCALSGCDAKKPLVNAAAAVDLVARLADGRGLDATVGIDWPQLIAFKRTFTDPMPAKERADLAKRGLDLAEGQPRFVDSHTLEVNDRRYTGKKILIATGMVPRPLDFQGAGLMTTSDEFLELDRLPKRIVFVGAGFVTMEFAHVAARAGSTVDIVEMSDRALQPFDADMVNHLVEDSKQLGIRFHFNSCVDRIERTDSGLVARCCKSGESYTADMILHGAGRVPSIMGLGLEAAGIAVDDGGVAVNEFLQNTTNPDVYAAGDCSGSPGPPLTPVANLEADAVATNLLEGNSATVDYTGIPSAVFTTPCLSAVGLTQGQARQRDIEVEVRTEEIASSKKLEQLGVRRAAYKVLIDRSTDRLVGAHFYGPAAQDIVNLAAMAIRLKLTVKQLKKVVFAYPTLTGSFGSML